MSQPTNRSPLGFEDQTKKLSRWFWDPNHQTVAPGFEAQTGKPSTTMVLSLNQETHYRFWGQTRRNRRHQFWGQTGENHCHWFEAKPEKIVIAGFEAKPPETVTACFEAKPLEIVAAGFEAKPLETVTTGFEVKPVQTVRVVLRPNHSETVAIDFEVQTDEKPSEWFWGQITHKPPPSVLRPKPMRNRRPWF
jgi:hypothetical protein